MKLYVDGKLNGDYGGRDELFAAMLAALQTAEREVRAPDYGTLTRSAGKWRWSKLPADLEPTIRECQRRIRRLSGFGYGTGGGSRVIRKPLPE